MNKPLIVQAVGTTLIVMSLLLIAIPLGVAFAGLSLIAFGIAAERT
jgi:hypothetical protein